MMTPTFPLALFPQLAVRRTAAGRVILRVDAIRTDTLTALASAWCADDGVLDHRIARLAEDHEAGHAEYVELDVADVESAAEMDAAEVEVTRDEALRLYRELGEALGLMPETPRPAGMRGDR